MKMNLQNKRENENVEHLLANIVPQADESFMIGLERRLSALYQEESTSKSRTRRWPRIPNFNRSNRKWAWSMASIVIIILAVSALAIPSIGTYAQEAIQYFNRTVNEIVKIGFIVRDIDLVNPTMETDFNVASIEEATARAGIHVKAPTYLPDGFYLDSIIASKGNPGAGLIYKRSGYPAGFLTIEQFDPDRVEMVTTCQISQKTILAEIDEAGNPVQQGEPFDEALAESELCDELADVGVDAEILLVQIGDETGEYVAGDWVIEPHDNSLQDKQPGEQVNNEYVWDPDHPKHWLRWEDNGVAYDITAIGEGLTMDEIIQIAESMQ
jgi:hypothetical protein